MEEIVEAIVELTGMIIVVGVGIIAAIVVLAIRRR